MLLIYETSLKLHSFYNDIATVKDYQQTLTALALLPTIWLVLWLTRIPDSWLLWGAVNIAYCWPLIKAPTGLLLDVSGLGRVKKLLIK